MTVTEAEFWSNQVSGHTLPPGHTSVSQKISPAMVHKDGLSADPDLCQLGLRRFDPQLLAARKGAIIEELSAKMA